MAFNVTFEETSFRASFADGQTFDADLTNVIQIPVPPYEGSYTITATESEQVLPTEGLLSTDDFTVEGIPSDYVGSAIDRRSGSSLSVSGATVSVPEGYYSQSASASVQSGTATPASSISATGATLSAGENTLTLSKTVSNTPTVSEGYVTSGMAGDTDVTLTASVNTRSSTDLTANGATVTAPSGYYASDASKTISNATLRGGSRIEHDPTIAVDESGLITALYDHSSIVSPINGNGYITTGARYSVRMVGSATYQLTDGDILSYGIVPLVGSAKVGSAVLCEEGE